MEGEKKELRVGGGIDVFDVIEFNLWLDNLWIWIGRSVDLFNEISILITYE